MSGAQDRTGGPWYERFFGPEFWAVAAHEYTAERTAAEAEYLAAVLEASAPGRRVLDLGCGTGRHAIALARRGFEVTGVDVGAWALKEAEAAASASGVPVQWQHQDLLRELPWSLGVFDAIVCVQSFGWGSDDQQVRLLQEARRSLVPGGLLILDHSNVLCIAGQYVPEATFQVEGLRADFRRAYRMVPGRSTGEIEVQRGDAEPVTIHDDVRMYQPAEVRALLTRAGFAVERVDTDFLVGREPVTTSRYVQFVARSPRRPAGAISSWELPQGRPEALDLRWSPDEIECVAPAVDAAFRDVYEGGSIADLARDYPVMDPYAADRSAPVLSEHFGVDLSPNMVTAGTGATGLLHACAALAAPGPVLHLAGAHPDLPRWAALLGAEAVVTRLAALAADLDRHAPSVLVLDRPTALGTMPDSSLLDEVVEAARAHGTIVVLDEAYAVYAGPAASFAPAVTEHDNLVVVRSMSKGYCCGGLRIGFALAAPALTRRLREFAPPLGANSAGLAVALRLLGQGDVFAGLRARIAEVKPMVAATLRRSGLEVTEGADCLPWVTARGGPAAKDVLAKHGLRAKEIDPAVLKIAVPLSAARLASFRAAFAHDG